MTWIGQRAEDLDGVEILGEQVVVAHDADGAWREGQVDLEGVVVREATFAPDEIAGREAEARAFLVPSWFRDRCGAQLGQDAERGFGALLLQVRAVHLWTALHPDGAQSRAYTLVEGGVVTVEVDAEGLLTAVGTVAGRAGLTALDLEDQTRERLPDRHATPFPAQTWGEAFAHARAHGAGVVTVREARDRRVVSLVCEAPLSHDVRFYPHFAGVGRVAEVPVVRHLRTYVLHRRSPPSVTALGDPGGLLDPETCSLLASVVGRRGELTLARALLERLRDSIPDGAEAVPGGASALARQVRARNPDHFTRSGLDALLA